MHKRYPTLAILIITLLVFGQSVFAQLSIQFIPELYGRNIDGLFRCNIISTGGRQTAVLTITVSERKGGTVCVAKTPAFAIGTGSNQVPYTASRNATIQFSNNNIGRISSMNRTFPEGDYEYCFSVSTGLDTQPTEQCFNYALAPFAELNLIDPYDQDKICNTRPVLSWQPLLPGIAGSYYQLVLAEVKTGQSATEALNYNLAIINQGNLTTPVLPYPSISKALEKGKKYAWQVSAYKDGTVLNRSEVWDFTIDCQDTVKKVSDDGYRDIEDLSRGNYYVAVGLIKFALVNSYQATDLKYEITSINTPDKKVKGLPKRKLNTGLNQVSIDLGQARGMTDNEYYILKVWLPNGATKSLRFLYQEVK